MQSRSTIVLDDFKGGIDDRRVGGVKDHSRFANLLNVWTDIDGNLKRRPGMTASGELAPLESIGYIVKDGRLKALVPRGAAVTPAPPNRFLSDILYFDVPIASTVHELISTDTTGRTPLAIIAHDGRNRIHIFDDLANELTMVSDWDAPRTADVITSSQARCFVGSESGEHLLFSGSGNPRVWNRRNEQEIMSIGHGVHFTSPSVTNAVAQCWLTPADGGKLSSSIGAGSQTSYAAYFVQEYMGQSTDEVFDESLWGDGITAGAVFSEVTSTPTVAGTCLFQSLAPPSGVPSTNATWVRVSAMASASSKMLRAIVVPAADDKYWSVNRPISGTIPGDATVQSETYLGITSTGGATYELPGDFIFVAAAGHWTVIVDGVLKVNGVDYTVQQSTLGALKAKIVFATPPLSNAFIDIYQKMFVGLSVIVPAGVVRVRGADKAFDGGQVSVPSANGSYFISIPITSTGGFGTLSTVTDNGSVSGSVRWSNLFVAVVTVSGGAITSVSNAKLLTTNRNGAADISERERFSLLAGSQDAGWIALSNQAVSAPIMGIAAAKDYLLVHTETGVQQWYVPADPAATAMLGASPLPKSSRFSKGRFDTWDAGSIVDPTTGSAPTTDGDGGSIVRDYFGRRFRSCATMENDRALIRTPTSVYLTSFAGQLFNSVRTEEISVGLSASAIGVQDRPFAVNIDRGLVVCPNASGKSATIMVSSSERKIAAWTKWGFSIGDCTDIFFSPEGNLVGVSAESIEGVTWRRVLSVNTSGDATAFKDAGDGVGTAYPSEIKWHFLDFSYPGKQKHLLGCDVVMSGQWDLSFGSDPRNPVLFSPSIRLSETSYNGGRIPLAMHATMLSIKLTSSSETGASLERLTLDLRLKDR